MHGKDCAIGISSLCVKVGLIQLPESLGFPYRRVWGPKLWVSNAKLKVDGFVVVVADDRRQVFILRIQVSVVLVLQFDFNINDLVR